MARALGGTDGTARLAELAAAVSERKKDPFSAVNEILEKSGLLDAASKSGTVRN
jgi:hypothetical protein